MCIYNKYLLLIMELKRNKTNESVYQVSDIIIQRKYSCALKHNVSTVFVE